MKYLHADDGRILTPPKELKPLLRGAFPAFHNFVGLIRFLYIADEIWDGKTSLVFKTADELLTEVTLDDGAFHINIAGKIFRITDETELDMVYEVLKKSSTEKQRRPFDQLTPHLDKYPCGIRCDMCAVNKINNENDFAGSEKFHTMDWHCYHPEYGEERQDFTKAVCQGCVSRKEICSTHICLEEKEIRNCFECGEFRTCNHCGVGHNPGECNLGITAEEVTNLIIPYCEVERLDLIRRDIEDR